MENVNEKTLSFSTILSAGRATEKAVGIRIIFRKLILEVMGASEVTKIDCKCTCTPIVVCLQMPTPLVMAQRSYEASCSAPHHCPPYLQHPSPLLHNTHVVWLFPCSWSSVSFTRAYSELSDIQ
ncbi:UNVERIFIED_CONTAM: hypothetical protein H355_007686 [Colinus virginianus]|nr:hypothetical protein H355_007686 [Colinus virginianus]